MKIKATPVFQRNRDCDKKIVINRWGTRSSKTFSILQVILVRLISWKIDNSWKVFESWICTIVRKEKTTLKATAIRDREEIIMESECDFLLKDEHRNLTDKIYRYWWRIVQFVGADDQQKLRWLKQDILYCNEANSLNYDQEFFQLFIRTTYKTFIDFNPDNDDIWINTEIEQKRQHEEGDVWVIISTYRDNPFLPVSQVKEIERLQETNPQYWRIYWLGEYGKLEWIIFTNWKTCESVPDTAKLVWRWLDFWFTNDPTAMVAVYKWDSVIYLDEEIYETWLLNSDIDAKAVSLWIEKRDKVIADCAEPKSIEELYRKKRNIQPCKKWKDSITYWISLMQQYTIVITSRSKNLIREFKWYCREVDKNGKTTNKPMWWMDHAIDAVRYLFMSLLDTREEKKAWFMQAKR